MAKTKHHQFIDTVDELFTRAINKGIMHLRVEDQILVGNLISVKGKNLVNFGSCSYMGLELDERIKQGTIEAVLKYGSQFSASKAYICSPNYLELENLMSEIFGADTLISTSSSAGHIATIPTIVRDVDAIILDQQVHVSVQTAVQLVKQRGVPVEIIKHSNLEMLEVKIKELGQKYQKIWYMVDGVYSMYGDFAPIHDLIKLLDKYQQLNLYADDAHGMSWTGKHGRGYILSQVNLHQKMVVATSMAKAFGTGGGIFVFPNKELCRKVKLCGGPLTYSGPLQPPMIGASIASAKIHLSDEFPILQQELREKIDYCNSIIKSSELPLISESCAPIFYIGMGLPNMGFNMIKRLIDEGFYVNIGIFPGVPVKCTGIRFTITRHHTKENIDNFVDAMKYHFPKALEEEQRCVNDIRKAFKMNLIEDKKSNEVPYESSLKTEEYASISEINKAEWDSLIKAEGPYNWEGLKFLEDTFSNNPENYNNWKFFYFIIRKNDIPVLATFFTLTYWKEDIFSPRFISEQIEQKRKSDPNHLVSQMLCMGSPLTEGSHLFIDRSQNDWKDVFTCLLKTISRIQEEININTIVLRDFNTKDEELKNYLMDQGYIKITIPDTNIIENVTWTTTEELLNTLSKKTRQHFRSQILKQEDYFEIEEVKNPSLEEMKYFHDLYLNVKNRNLEINTFDLPIKLIARIFNDPNWDIFSIKLKQEYEEKEKRLPLAVIFSFKSEHAYSPIFLGLDYNYLSSHEIYRQSLFQMVKRGKTLGYKKITLGFSASFEKKKLGAKSIPKVAYIQSKDNFNMELMENINVNYN